jgi:tRNA-(ms[2]io[6]A)-hydroxylase
VLKLRHRTPEQWKQVATKDLDAFLQDHAANERKVSHSALMLAVHHPDKTELVETLVPLAEEEFGHFLEVYALLRERGIGLGQDVPDPYMGALFRLLEKRAVDGYLLDRLILFAIVEARGCERFRMMEEALEPGPLKDFYRRLVASEARHHTTYLELARRYFGDEVASSRLDALLDAEAGIVRGLPLRPALH